MINMQETRGCREADYNVKQLQGGGFAPCVRYIDLDGTLSRYRDVATFHASPEMQQLRTDLNAGIRRPECSRCWDIEDLGSVSIRNVKNQLYALPRPVALRSIEISTGRTCALKCRTCSAYYSTALESEDRLRGIYHDIATQDVSSIDPAVYQHVEYIKALGGEPFNSKEFIKLLQMLVSSGQAANITLDIYTNSTAFPDPAYTENLKKFKKVKINLSIDGVGARNDYIRSGSTWQQVLDTVIAWGYFRTQTADLISQIRIAHTISTFNVLYFEEMVDFVRQCQRKPGLADMYIASWFANGLSLFDLRFLPREHREELSYLWLSNLCNDGYDTYRRYVADRLLVDDPIGSQSIPEWLREQHILDELRKQDMQSALPEVFSMLTENTIPLYDKYPRQEASR